MFEIRRLVAEIYFINRKEIEMILFELPKVSELISYQITMDY